MDGSWHKGIIWLKCAVVLDLTWFWFWSLVDRRRSFLSRGRSFFLEPDADMEDSESRSPVCTPGINSLCHAVGWYMRMANVVLNLFLSHFAVLCLHDLYLHPELLPQYLSQQTRRPFQPGSHQLWTLWEWCEKLLKYFSSFMLFVSQCKRWHDVILSFFRV